MSKRGGPTWGCIFAGIRRDGEWKWTSSGWLRLRGCASVRRLAGWLAGAALERVVYCAQWPSKGPSRSRSSSWAPRTVFVWHSKELPHKKGGGKIDKAQKHSSCASCSCVLTCGRNASHVLAYFWGEGLLKGWQSLHLSLSVKELKRSTNVRGLGVCWVKCAQGAVW